MHMDPYDVMFNLEFPRNPNHPRETYEEYVARLIESKKELIDGLASKT